MAFTKILESDITDNGVQSQQNKLTGSALENKKVFDKLIEEVVAVKFNALIDELLAQTAAAQIGCSVSGMTSTNLGAAMLELLGIVSVISQGGVAPDTIETGMIKDHQVTGVKLLDVIPDDVGIKMGTTVPTTSDIGEGEIYLKYSLPV